MKRQLRSILIYVASILVSAGVTLATIPVVVARFGPADWGALALGQAIGVGAAVLIGFGWGTTGPAMVAKSAGMSRVGIYNESICGRMVLSAPILLASFSLTYFVASEAKLEAALNAVAFGVTGLLGGWYFTGVGEPVKFFFFDTTPRVGGTTLGLVFISSGSPLVYFPLVQLLGILGGVIFSTAIIMGRVPRLRMRAVLRVLGGQSHGMAIAVVAASYAAIPSSLVSLFAPGSLPGYALSDKLLRFGTTAFSPLIQMLQGWVPGGPRNGLRRRVWIALLLGVVLTLIVVVGFGLMAPLIADFLSHSSIMVSPALMWGFAAALGIMFLAQVIGLVCLVALDHAKRLARYTVLGAIVGLPLMVLGAVFFGGVGAIWMLCVGELTALIPQAILLAGLLADRADGTVADAVGVQDPSGNVA